MEVGSIHVALRTRNGGRTAEEPTGFERRLSGVAERAVGVALVFSLAHKCLGVLGHTERFTLQKVRQDTPIRNDASCSSLVVSSHSPLPSQIWLSTMVIASKQRPGPATKAFAGFDRGGEGVRATRRFAGGSARIHVHSLVKYTGSDEIGRWIVFTGRYVHWTDVLGICIARDPTKACAGSNSGRFIAYIPAKQLHSSATT